MLRGTTGGGNTKYLEVKFFTCSSLSINIQCADEKKIRAFMAMNFITIGALSNFIDMLDVVAEDKTL